MPLISLIRLTKCSVPANSSRALKHGKHGYEDRFRTNRALLAQLGMGSGTNLPREIQANAFTDADLQDILRDGK